MFFKIKKIMSILESMLLYVNFYIFTFRQANHSITYTQTPSNLNNPRQNLRFTVEFTIKLAKLFIKICEFKDFYMIKR